MAYTKDDMLGVIRTMMPKLKKTPKDVAISVLMKGGRTLEDVREELEVILGEKIEEIKPVKGVDYFDGKDGEDSLVPGPKGDKGDKGDKGEPGKNGKNGRDGKDGESIDESKVRAVVEDLFKENLPEDIVTEKELERILSKKKFSVKSLSDLEARLNTLRADVMRNYGGHGMKIQVHDLSGSLDGATKTFTIPNHKLILQISSSSVPFVFRPITDFTETATSVTFTSGIDAESMLAAGQTMVILYIA